MNPIRYAGVVAFLDWIRRSRPAIRTLRTLTEEEFLALAVEYESSKGLMINESHQVYMKWRSTHWLFKQSTSDGDALERLRGIG